MTLYHTRNMVDKLAFKRFSGFRKEGKHIKNYEANRRLTQNDEIHYGPIEL